MVDSKGRAVSWSFNEVYLLLMLIRLLYRNTNRSFMLTVFILRRILSESLTLMSSSKNQRKWTKVVDRRRKTVVNHKRAAVARQIFQRARKTNKGRMAMPFCLNSFSSTEYLTSEKAVFPRVLTVWCLLPLMAVNYSHRLKLLAFFVNIVIFHCLHLLCLPIWYISRTKPKSWKEIKVCTVKISFCWFDLFYSEKTYFYKVFIRPFWKCLYVLITKIWNSVHSSQPTLARSSKTVYLFYPQV